MSTVSPAVNQVSEMDVAGSDQVGGGGVQGGEPQHGQLVLGVLGAGDGGSEGLPVLDAHHVVQEGVQGGGEIVETAREVEQNLVNCPKHFVVL